MKTQPQRRNDSNESAPAAPPARRTAKFDVAISSLNSQLAALTQERREKVRDLNTDPETLAKINTQMQALRDKIEGQRELRSEAAKLDVRDDFMRERSNMRALQEELLQTIGSREDLAEQLDSACTAIGDLLEKIEATNRDAWAKFRTLSRYITRGDARTARYDALIYSNQSRIMDAGAVAPAFAYALKFAGVGRRGIMGTDAFESVVTFRAGTRQPMRDAMHEANERVARHLALVFQQKADEVLALDDETEPAPSQAETDFSKPPIA